MDKKTLLMLLYLFLFVGITKKIYLCFTFFEGLEIFASSKEGCLNRAVLTTNIPSSFKLAVCLKHLRKLCVRYCVSQQGHKCYKVTNAWNMF